MGVGTLVGASTLNSVVISKRSNLARRMEAHLQVNFAPNTKKVLQREGHLVWLQKNVEADVPILHQEPHVGGESL